jgi:hypothetical protein
MLDSTISNDEINVSGYDIVRKDRNRNGGGVALYIRNVIDYKIRNDLMNENLETITIEVCLPKAKLNHSLLTLGVAHQMLLLNFRVV